MVTKGLTMHSKPSTENHKALEKLKFLMDDGGRKRVPLVTTSKVVDKRTKDICCDNKQKVFETFVKTRGKIVLEPPEIRKPMMSEKSAPIVFNTLNRLDKNMPKAVRARETMRLPRDTRYDL